jgi:pimeloyl-ACP methyl ester carboxylesterase
MHLHSRLLHHEIHTLDPAADWLLFIHGAGGSTVTWKRQVPVLKHHYNLLLVDLPGHGQMAGEQNKEPVYSFEGIAARIWSVVEHLKIQHVHLIGVSLGTVIALTMRDQFPDKVRSLINGGAIIRLSNRLKFLASSSLALARIIGYPAFYELSARIMMPRKNHQRSREVFIRESKVLSTEEFRKWTNLYRGLNKTLKRLFESPSNIPQLLVMGEQDHLFLGQAARYARYHGTIIRFEVLKRCGHVVSIEQADLFNALCLDHLARVAVKRAL